MLLFRHYRSTTLKTSKKKNSVLDKDLFVRDNLQSRAALYGITGKDFKERLAELAKLLEFENLLKRMVGKLSICLL